MFGAILGDFVGSRYEGIVFFKNGEPPSIGFDLVSDLSTFTDDTVLTVASAAALMGDGDFKAAYVAWTLKYPDAGFGASFQAWSKGELGEDHPPYYSFGNGSAMRVSPVPWVASSRGVDDADLASRSAAVTHNHPEGIEGAVIVSRAIRCALMGWDPDRIRADLETKAPSYNLKRTVQEIMDSGYGFDVTSLGSVPEAIVCALEATSFEEAIRMAVHLNGDTDTQAAIAGSIAEARFHDPSRGLTPLWETDLAKKVLSRLPQEMVEVAGRFKQYMY